MNSTNLEEKAAEIPRPNEERKEKVRRKRQYCQKPYKQIPLNMAEARREIKTALKLHRSASTKQKQIIQSFPQFYFQTRSGFIASQTPNFNIPSQNLGLNLSFDDHFKAANTNASYSSFCSFFPVSCAATHQEVPKSILLSEEEGKLMGSDLKIKEVMNNVKDLEIDDQIQFGFDNVPTGEPEKDIEFPDWLSINDDLSAEVDCLQDPHLSCLDIGEIEDVDGDWLILMVWNIRVFLFKEY